MTKLILIGCIILLASGCQVMPSGCKGEIILGSGGSFDCQKESNNGDH